MSYAVVVTPLREDRISMYHRMKIPTVYKCEQFSEAQQMCFILFDLYQFREQPMWQDEYTGEYSFEGEGFLIEIKEI